MYETNEPLSSLAGIGEKLRQERKMRDVKLQTVANSLAISHSVISQVENGRYDCSWAS